MADHQPEKTHILAQRNKILMQDHTAVPSELNSVVEHAKNKAHAFFGLWKAP